MRIPAVFGLGCVAAVLALGSASPARPRRVPPAPAARQAAFLDTLERRTFEWFWDLCDPGTGLTPDRWPTRSFASMGATGFALTAYPIGAERGYVTRAQAARRTLATLRFLWGARQDTAARGATGYRGFFYHFVDPATGERFEDVELSTVDSALLFAGALFCQSYFDRADSAESGVRALAESLYARADWTWAQARPPAIAHGWRPREGLLPYDWIGYDEAMILYVLALGSPTHAVAPEAWEAWTRGYRWGTFQGQEHLGFAPLFGHQYSHLWIDFRGIRDATMRGRGIDYFENSRRATLAQRAYAIANPSGFRGYGERLWGLSACDGPLDGTVTIDGRAREFHTYQARGASFVRVTDDGTIAPTAAASSIAFAPEVVIPALVAMRYDWGDRLFGRYGFVDALNPTLVVPVATHHGQVDPGRGWFDTDYLGIDQGPILAMIENHRSGLVWRVMRKNPHVVRGLRRAGFAGGWLDSAAAGR
ncbi:MAG TPA: glucoamylase family protein [Candidatus Eisenbacteria bacterium]